MQVIRLQTDVALEIRKGDKIQLHFQAYQIQTISTGAALLF